MTQEYATWRPIKPSGRSRGLTAQDVLRLAARAQAKPAVIGWLHMGSREVSGRELAAFKEGLAALGWKEGAQYVVEERWALGRVDRLQPLADDLAKTKPAVVVSWPTQPIRPSLKAMPHVPVVQVNLNVVEEFTESQRGAGGFGSTGKH